MSYTTPHSAREFLFAGALFICHDYKLRCQRRAVKHKKELMRGTREIDLCAKLGVFFGPTAQIAAQGMRGNDAIDLAVSGPTIRAEVKYFNDQQSFSGKLARDWDWLLSTSNANQEFSRRAWVVFWPSSANGMFTFTNCLSVPKSHGTQYSHKDYPPFLPYAEPEMPANGVNQRLTFRTPPRKSLIKFTHGKKVRVDIVGEITDPLWCAIYTRLPPGETNIPLTAQFDTDDAPIVL